MRQRRARIFSVIFVLSLLFTSVTSAQAPSEDERLKTASAHFQRGVALFQEGAFRAALVEFERANEVAPDYRLLYNIGQTKLQLQDYLGATQSYERYLAEGGADIPEARREDVERAFQILRERVGRIGVTTNLDGAEVFIDEQRAGVTPMPSTVAVNVGRHRVYARTSDGAEASQVVDIAGGDLIEVELTLVAPEVKTTIVAEKRKPLPLKRKIAIASWAAGAAAAGVAVWAGLTAQGDADDRSAELKKPLPDPGQVNDLGDSAQSMALTSDIMSVVAIGAVTAGVVLWIIGGEDEATADEPPATARVHFGVGLGSVSMGGRF
jgi:tetratricopeptide (TPR) repeat protein